MIDIWNMSYLQLARAVSKNKVSLDFIRKQYTRERKRAMSQNRKIMKTTEFGTIAKEDFDPQSLLVTTQSLLKAFVDVRAYNKSYRSTISGLKARRKQNIETLHEHRFDFVTEKNYGDWVDFMDWFESSEYAAFYDSNDTEVEDIFLKGSSSEDWEDLFNKVRGGKVVNQGDKRY